MLGRMTIAICLWFNGTAEEAAEFYTSVVPNSRITGRQASAADNPSTAKGDLLLVTFTLDGIPFTALNGGPQFTHSPAASIELHCATQEEADRAWDAFLAGGGTAGQCGWLTDRFGVSWQVIPDEMGQYLGGPDPAGRERAMAAMLTMTRLDVATMKAAYEGPPTA